MTHFLDVLLHLGGVPVESVIAELDRDPSSDDVEDQISASFRFANGAIGNLIGGGAVPGTWEGVDTTDFRLWGTDGQLSIGKQLSVFSLRGAGGLRPARWHLLDGVAPVDERAAFVSRFVTAVHRGHKPDISLEDGLAVQAFVEAAYQSGEEGRAVRTDSLAESVAASPS
jgi:predicted dehydrogenase